MVSFLVWNFPWDTTGSKVIGGEAVLKCSWFGGATCVLVQSITKVRFQLGLTPALAMPVRDMCPNLSVFTVRAAALRLLQCGEGWRC